MLVISVLWFTSIKNNNLKIFSWLLVTSLAIVLSENDPYESRPYEFGFTIHGQQHRLEKKGENGIIQGEFGFITADGVYHVTVYATDENGNFKILSMKNIRISEPLDYASDVKMNANFGRPDLHSQITKSSQPKNPDAILKNKNIPFTTLPTIKPGCAGCGLVTTPIPGKGMGHRSKVINNVTSTYPSEITALYSKPFSGTLHSVPPLNIISELTSLTSSDVNHKNTDRRYKNIIPSNLYFPTDDLRSLDVTSKSPGSGQNTLSRFNGSVSFSGKTSENEKMEQDMNSGFQRLDHSKPSAAYPPLSSGKRITQQLSDRDFTTLKLPPVMVSNGVIHVEGKIDVPISDKYQGMVDGLPDGIKESDIKNILYKFKYEVGFHGHYEKGLKNGAKIGGYFVNGRDGISRVVTYVADENGYRPKFKFIRLGLDSSDIPKEDSEKTFGLKSFEFVWYPIEL